MCTRRVGLAVSALFKVHAVNGLLLICCSRWSVAKSSDRALDSIYKRTDSLSVCPYPGARSERTVADIYAISLDGPSATFQVHGWGQGEG